VTSSPRVAVIIPSYRVRAHILEVLSAIGPECSRIYVVDDCCPDGSGEFVRQHCQDPRVTVLRNPSNLGVGGAVMAGYRAALDDGADILIKLDGDGQMEPRLIPDFVAPIAAGEADYAKGNRFFDLEGVRSMPFLRLFGNAVLSFMTKLSSGYWDLFDPTNGYTALHRTAARQLPFDKISRRYFFETDLLFRLNIARAVVVDVPMQARYGGEVSHLRIGAIVGEFLFCHFRNFWKRLFYSYYLRDMSIASIELPLGLAMLLFGMAFGGYQWAHAMAAGQVASAGTVMLSALPVITGLQLVLAFLGHDISTVPRRPLQRIGQPWDRPGA
jgi:dolichol-phosphate mannosyltransferase